MKRFTLVAAAAAALAAAPAFAQPGLYITGGIGFGEADFSSTDFPSDANFERSTDTKDTTWNLGVGYRFSPNWAVELGYTELGDYNARQTGTGPEAGNFFDQDYEVKAWKLAGVGTLPLGRSFSVLGKLGVARTTAELSETSLDLGVPGSLNRKKSRNRLFWGIGAQYDFSQRLGLRLEYENYGDVGSRLTNSDGPGEAEVSSINLNLVYSFR